jgi:hypothetical protein
MNKTEIEAWALNLERAAGQGGGVLGADAASEEESSTDRERRT